MAKKVLRECTDGLSAKGELMWKLDGHRLVIGGNGRMRDFTDAVHTPWLPLADQIWSVVVEDGVENIGGQAFQGFPALRDVTLSSTVTRIGWRAFAGCCRLETVTGGRPLRHWRLPNVSDVTLVGHQAFRGTQIPQEEMVVHDGVVLEYTGSNPVVVIPEGIRQIAPYAFAQIPLKSVVFPRSLEQIGHGAFYATGLKAVVFPQKLQQVEAFAFAGNPELSQVFLGRVSVNLDPTAFAHTSVEVDKRIGRWLLSCAAKNLSFVEVDNGKWSVSELKSVVKRGGVVLLVERLWDGRTTVRSCFQDYQGFPMSYQLFPCLAEEGILGDQAVACQDLATFRKRYADADTWLIPSGEDMDYWEEEDLMASLRAWKSSVRKWGDKLYLSWDQGNVEGPLELALCEKWLDEHPDAFVGILKPAA